MKFVMCFRCPITCFCEPQKIKPYHEDYDKESLTYRTENCPLLRLIEEFKGESVG